MLAALYCYYSGGSGAQLESGGLRRSPEERREGRGPRGEVQHTGGAVALTPLPLAELSVLCVWRTFEVSTSSTSPVLPCLLPTETVL